MSILFFTSSSHELFLYTEKTIFKIKFFKFFWRSNRTNKKNEFAWLERIHPALVLDWSWAAVVVVEQWLPDPPLFSCLTSQYNSNVVCSRHRRWRWQWSNSLTITYKNNPLTIIIHWSAIKDHHASSILSILLVWPSPVEIDELEHWIVFLCSVCYRVNMPG